MKEVTVCCTACGRPDLLEKTLHSFIRYNTYPIFRFLVMEDSGISFINDHLKTLFPKVEFLYNDGRIGQIASIDKLYSLVETPYIFHLEEDWLFYRTGFIEASMKILERDPRIMQVWIRHPTDTNGHPHRPSLVGNYRIMSTNHRSAWHGFSFNPGLRRLKDYKLIAPFTASTQDGLMNPAAAEIAIGKQFHRLGFRAALLPEGYVRHIGQNRHVKAPAR